MLRIVEPLPIDAQVSPLVAAVCAGRDVVLAAPPGSGKTTRVPPALLDAGLSVAVLEPRRIAARLAAARVAAERGERLGHRIGYQVRFEKVAGRDTRLMFVTEGLLARRLLRDEALEGVDCVVFDEFHERSVHVDLALGLVREVQAALRPELRIVLMSATLDAESLAAALGAVAMRAEGRRFDVDVSYDERPDPAPLPVRVVKAIARHIDSMGGSLRGDVLAFLPGAGEIARASDELRALLGSRAIDVLPLHGDLPLDAQERAIRKGPRPRVVLATNVAETSLTLDGIDTVVDGGMARVVRYDADSGLEELRLERISRASAEQRAGRAGRQGPGRCIRLWTRAEQHSLRERLEPEVERIDLCETLLLLAAWGVKDPTGFPWITAPDPANLRAGLTLLERLGAVESGAITPLGRRLAELPVHPRIGRMLLAARDLGCGKDGALLAALAQSRSPLRGARPVAGPSDLLHLRDAFHDAMHGAATGVDRRILATIDRERAQLERLVGSGSDATDDQLLKCVVAGFPDRLARRRGASEAIGAGGVVVEIAPESCVRDAELMVAVDAALVAGGRRAKARVLSEARREWLEELHPHLLRDVRVTEWNEAKGRAEGRVRRYFLDLPLDEGRPCDPDRERAAQLLAAAATHPRFLAELQSGALERLRLRIACVRAAMPELGWSEVGEDAIAAVVREQCEGRASLAEVRAAPLAAALLASLPPDAARRLDRLAPEHLALPSGRSVEIEYRAGQMPRVAGRMQEFFGTADSPRICDGRVVVALDLLAPSNRSVQITSDLRSFWSTLYPKERRELMRRYPRHSWPEDPGNAAATSRPVPRKR